MPVLLPEVLIDERVKSLKDAHEKAGLPKAELDLSGGIDSAVMAGLLVLAVGPDNLILVHSNINSNPVQTARATALAEALGVPMQNVDLGDVYADILATILNAVEAVQPPDVVDAMMKRIKADPTILGSIRSTLRAPVGRAFNRILGGGIRHGTGNEDEDRFLRFYQKGGDGEVDSNPIAFLSKGEVYQLAVALGKRLNAEAAFRPIIEALPSPDLWGVGDDHSDESELKKWLGAAFTYSRVNPDTGEYTSVGTIERVNRFLDVQSWGARPVSDYLFGVNRPDWVSMVTEALESALFGDSRRSDVEALLVGARKAEAATRHKLNPNIPMYGDRATLIQKGILTDTLPTL